MNLPLKNLEDDLKSALAATELFRTVRSGGREPEPAALNFPAAIVFFLGDRDLGTEPRPTLGLNFGVTVYNRNVASVGDASRDTYDLLDAVRDAINGKTFGRLQMDAWRCVSREFVDYADGVIAYLITFSTTHWLDVPTP